MEGSPALPSISAEELGSVAGLSSLIHAIIRATGRFARLIAAVDLTAMPPPSLRVQAVTDRDHLPAGALARSATLLTLEVVTAGRIHVVAPGWATAETIGPAWLAFSVANQVACMATVGTTIGAGRATGRTRSTFAVELGGIAVAGTAGLARLTARNANLILANQSAVAVVRSAAGLVLASTTFANIALTLEPGDVCALDLARATRLVRFAATPAESIRALEPLDVLTSTGSVTRPARTASPERVATRLAHPRSARARGRGRIRSSFRCARARASAQSGVRVSCRIRFARIRAGDLFYAYQPVVALVVRATARSLFSAGVVALLERVDVVHEATRGQRARDRADPDAQTAYHSLHMVPLDGLTRNAKGNRS
jgi:hypothetical protein